MTETKKMFKVLCPMEGRNGSTWWMRCGTGFKNKDDSINMYLDCVPTKAGFHLQLREVTEEDMRFDAERRAARTNPPGSARADASFDPKAHRVESFNSNQSVPF
jgi:hypothetical protein